MKVLIVDDSKAMRFMIKRILRQLDAGPMDTVEAENGKQALEVAELEAPDLILSDWNMPEMNGIDFLRAYRESGKQTPFGFVTTETSDKMRNLAEDAGAQFLIGKPFTADSFQEKLGPILAA